MKVKMFLTILTGAAAMLYAAGASAQTADDEATDETPVGAAEFVDADGDGICDNVADRHAVRNRNLRDAYQNQQKRMMRRAQRDLSPEQRQEIRSLVDEMRAGEASREEIHAAVGAKLEGFGVGLPEGWGESFQQFREQTKLSPEQRTELQSLVQTLKDEGKTGQEIREAVKAKYDEWGKRMPPGRPMGNHGFRGGPVPPPPADGTEPPPAE